MSALRRVRRLALRAPRAELARRGAILIEDALRTASLPGDDGRLVVVRRLDVGIVRPNAASSSVALAIEARMRAVAAQALPAEAANADRAPAVYFRSVVEAHAALALRLARDEPVAGWYWRAAVPAWDPSCSRAEGLRAIVFALAGREDAPAAVGVLLDTLARAGALRQLWLALTPQDAERIAAAEGWRPSSFSPTHDVESPAAAFGALPHAWQRVLAEAAQLGPRGDARIVWLAGHALRARSATLALAPDFGVRAATLAHVVERFVHLPLRESFRSRPPDAGPKQRNSPDSRAGALPLNPQPLTGQTPPLGAADEPVADADVQVLDTVHADGIAPSSPASSTDNVPSGQARESRHESGTERRPAEFPWMPETRAGGLLFLFNVWMRLGLPEWLQANPAWLEADLPRRLLAHTLVRLSIERGDPMWEMANVAASACVLPREFVLPERWRQGLTRDARWYVHRHVDGGGTRVLTDGSRRLVLARWASRAGEEVHALARDIALSRAVSSLPGEPVLDQLVNAWLLATRRWLRRYARIGLRALVLRPGGVSITRTHADVVLDHKLADLRIRRSGLDLDPGWLPWFGRVVGIRYDARESCS